MYLLFVFQVCVRPFVVKHIDNLPTFPVPSGETSSFSGHMVEELEAEQEEKENIYNVRINHQHASRQKQSLKPPRLGKWLDALRSASLGRLLPQLSSRLEERLLAVEARLEDSVSSLQRLSALEKRLEELEWQRNADKVELEQTSEARCHKNSSAFHFDPACNVMAGEEMFKLKLLGNAKKLQ